MHPFTALAVGFSGWILVMGMNTPWVSAAVVGVALVLGTARVRNASLLVAVGALALPVALSMLLIHAPYGTERIAPLITADGLAVAGVLTLRFVALISSLLAAGTFFTVADLAKALQAVPGGNRLSYLAGSTLQLFPQGAARVRAVREANALRGRLVTAKTMVPHLIMPVLTELLTTGAARGQALETAGYDLEGRRTVLRPVADSPVQRAIRWGFPVLCLGVAAWI